jgi:hypothetical protein
LNADQKRCGFSLIHKQTKIDQDGTTQETTMDWHKQYQEIAFKTFHTLHRMLQTDLDSDIEKELKKLGIDYSVILQAESFFDIQRAK